MSGTLAYRPDIDGLRAVAVLPVVLFHLGARGFYGGFVGVDVFFVISGYLITGILWAELQAGHYAIAGFYRRRVLRIFPALFVMLLVTALLGALLLAPIPLASLGRTLAATALFSSNLDFYALAGYFGPAAHELPLLHTWSLAVEEQFYIVWPLVLAVAWRGGAQRVRWVLAGLAALSFVHGAAVLRSDADAAFYWPSSRAWELLAGAALAVFPLPRLAQRGLREALALAGMAAVLGAVKFYSQAVAFPGMAALLPVLGASAVIAAGSHGPTWVGAALAWRPIVFIGKISFSLYLWHWPVIVLSRHVLLAEPGLATLVGQLVLSIGLATLSWWYVERPFRTGQVTRAPARAVLAGGAAAIAVATLAGGAAAASGGFPTRFGEPARAVADYLSYDGDRRYREGTCFVVRPGRQTFDAKSCLQAEPGVATLLLAGDSHAAHLWPGFRALAPGVHTLQATHTGCRPLLTQAGDPCSRHTRWLLQEWLPAHPQANVVLAGRWAPQDLPALRATLQAIRAYGGRVVVVGPVPQYTVALPALLARYADRPDVIEGARVRSLDDLDLRMATLVRESGATYFSAHDALCEARGCRLMATPRVPMQFDYGHFTEEGSQVLVRLMMNSKGAVPLANSQGAPVTAAASPSAPPPNRPRP